jgi:glycyl-tRNA synthetase beta subunit
MPSELLLEIGTEEIPSGYLDDALDALNALPNHRSRKTASEAQGI